MKVEDGALDKIRRLKVKLRGLKIKFDEAEANSLKAKSQITTEPGPCKVAQGSWDLAEIMETKYRCELQSLQMKNQALETQLKILKMRFE